MSERTEAGMPDHATDGASLIAAERQRQIDAEGWTPEHDATHRMGELADAAACLAATEPIFVRREQCEQNCRYSIGTTFVTPWPYETLGTIGQSWTAPWRRPQADRVRELVKAGALIAAEIDRLLLPESPEERHHRQLHDGELNEMPPEHE